MLASAATIRAKSPEAFRTISEVAVELDVPQHVLRFWEGRFAQIKPVKRAGGRRYYRPEDVDLLRGIRALLYREGFTIKGAQKILRDKGQRYVAELGRGEAGAVAVPAIRVVETVAVIERAPERPVSECPPPERVVQTRSNVIALERVFEPELPLVFQAPASQAATAGSVLAEEERVGLEILLAELLQLKARLRAVLPAGM